MHILHALFTPSLGGLEQAFVNITRVLAESGHHVSALMRPDAPYRFEVQAETTDVSFEQPRGFYDVRAMWRIRRLLKAKRPDMILAHAPRAISIMSYAAWGLGIPVCGMLHSYRVSRIRHADRLVVLTEDMRRFVVKHGYANGQVGIISNMVGLSNTVPPPAVLHTPLVIGGMGRFAPEKGYMCLLDAVAEMHRRGMKVQLKLAGKGPEEELLRAKAHALGIESIVSFEGWVLDKGAFFSEIDIFCLPSLEESFGIVLLEAMSRGVPIIATKTPGPLSILTHEKDALLVPINDAAAIADASMHMVQTAELPQQLALAAFDRVKEFRVEAVTRKWNAMVALTVSEARARRA